MHSSGYVAWQVDTDDEEDVGKQPSMKRSFSDSHMETLREAGPNLVIELQVLLLYPNFGHASMPGDARGKRPVAVRQRAASKYRLPSTDLASALCAAMTG